MGSISENLIEFADGVTLDVEMHEFHVDGERHQDETGAEVDCSEHDDEQRGHHLLTTSPEHPPYTRDGTPSTPENARMENSHNRHEQLDLRSEHSNYATNVDVVEYTEDQ